MSKRIFLLNKTLIHRKKRVFSVSTPCFMCLLRLSPRPQLHALGWLAGLLSSKLSSAAVASPWMCYKGFLGLTPCIHNRLGSAKSFAALKTTPYKHHALHKNHVLAGPLQGLFASYRITLSMVAGGTRRRRLNRGTLKNGWFTLKNPWLKYIKIDDLGVPPF